MSSILINMKKLAFISQPVLLITAIIFPAVAEACLAGGPGPNIGSPGIIWKNYRTEEAAVRFMPGIFHPDMDTGWVRMAFPDSAGAAGLDACVAAGPRFEACRGPGGISPACRNGLSWRHNVSIPGCSSASGFGASAPIFLYNQRCSSLNPGWALLQLSRNQVGV